jgi:hypothetical protein
LPGLIGNINPNIKVGRMANLFAFAWLYGVRQIVLGALCVCADEELVSLSSSCLLGAVDVVSCERDVYGKGSTCV